MFSYGVGFAQILKNGGNLGLEAFSEEGIVDVSEVVILSGEDMKGSFSVARVDIAESVDRHVLEKRAALGELLAEKGRVGVLRVDGFPPSYAPAESYDDDVGPRISRSSVGCGCGGKSRFKS
jgi:hypothetical protein